MLSCAFPARMLARLFLLDTTRRLLLCMKVVVLPLLRLASSLLAACMLHGAWRLASLMLGLPGAELHEEVPAPLGERLQSFLPPCLEAALA